MKSSLKINPIGKIISSALVTLPCPSNISLMWNFGSLLGLCLIIQILTGIFLSMHYSNSIDSAFFSVSHLMRDVNLGWLLRIFHANGASLFFVCLYLHIGRGMYFGGMWLKHTWMIGVTILILVMATAFLGYVLPWGQMSFWGATVITNLFSAIPYMGNDLVIWLWGGFAVDKATLSRFFSLHFLMPFLVLGLTCVHLLFLHQTGSSNPLGVSSNVDKVHFFPYFIVKDLMGMIFIVGILSFICLAYPWVLGDPENFIPADPLVTPLHIQPEWYFLFAYAILRSVPNKLGGVLALFASVTILYSLPFLISPDIKSYSFSPANCFLFTFMVLIVFLLTWIGARPVSSPFLKIGQILTVFYFSYFFLISVRSMVKFN